MRKKAVFNRVLAASAAFILIFTLTFAIAYSVEKKDLEESLKTAEEAPSDQTAAPEGEAEADPAGKPLTPANQVNLTNKVFDQPQKPAPQNKVIYLTFDDGPGEFTETLLDVLKENNVKATFFVTAGNEDKLDVLTREASEGHSIGVHSLTHKYNVIYSSTDAFWEDFNAMQDIIREKTGSETLLMRFPGGSSNTISSGVPGIMTTLTKQMKEKGYYYFDWNVDSDDAGSARSAEEVSENCKRGVENTRVSVILCHDIKEYTVKGMKLFIPWALENGYTFLPLTTDDTSFNAHHTVRN
ncbi:MAG: polysaccharide deacetylase [Clostridia bacterium]|nr:polysaccharide deacetylase [Clostridia bacterium]